MMTDLERGMKEVEEVLMEVEQDALVRERNLKLQVETRLEIAGKVRDLTRRHVLMTDLEELGYDLQVLRESWGELRRTLDRTLEDISSLERENQDLRNDDLRRVPALEKRLRELQDRLAKSTDAAHLKELEEQVRLSHLAQDQA